MDLIQKSRTITRRLQSELKVLELKKEGSISPKVRTKREDPQSGESDPTDRNATSERGIAPTIFRK